MCISRFTGDATSLPVKATLKQNTHISSYLIFFASYVNLIMPIIQYEAVICCRHQSNSRSTNYHVESLSTRTMHTFFKKMLVQHVDMERTSSVEQGYETEKKRNSSGVCCEHSSSLSHLAARGPLEEYLPSPSSYKEQAALPLLRFM